MPKIAPVANVWCSLPPRRSPPMNQGWAGASVGISGDKLIGWFGASAPRPVRQTGACPRGGYAVDVATRRADSPVNLYRIVGALMAH